MIRVDVLARMARDAREHEDAMPRRDTSCRCPEPVPSRCYLSHWLCALCQRLIASARMPQDRDGRPEPAPDTPATLDGPEKGRMAA